MRMVNPRFTDHVIAGLRQSFTFVAKRHLHSSLAYWILGLTIAFSATVIYVANEQGTFTFSSAQTENEIVELVTSEAVTSDYQLAVASGEKTNLVRWDPEYTRIPKDSNLSMVMLAATVLVAIVAPVALPALGLEGIGSSVAAGISSITGVSVETVTTVMSIVRGASTINTIATGVAGSAVNYTIPAGLGWGSAVTTGNPGAKILPASALMKSAISSSTTAAPAKKSVRGVTVPDMNSVKIGNRAIAEINKRTAANLKKLNGLVCGVSVKTLLRDNEDKIDTERLFAQLQGVANKEINDFKGARVGGRKNEVRAIYTIAAISGATLEAMRDMGKALFTARVMKQRCPVYEGDRLMSDSLASAKAAMASQDAMRQIRAIVENESAVASKTAREAYEGSDKRTVVEFERVGVKDATILTGIEDAPLPHSSWVGFKNADIHGKAAPDNTLMMALDSFVLTAIPARAFIGVRSTDTPIEVKLNGVPVNTIKARWNSKEKPPYKTFVYELKDVTGIGNNRLNIAIAQSAGSRAKFALNYAVYVICEPGIQCLSTAE